MTRIPNVWIPNKVTLPSIKEEEETDRDRMVAFTRAYAEAQESPSWAFVLDYLRTLSEIGIEASTMGLDMFQRCVAAAESKWAEASAEPPPRTSPNTKPHESIVYYMKLGNLVKIGISRRLAQRAMTFNPQRILAVEPGSHALEKVRHRQFVDLHEQGEWFRYEQKLKDHIRQIPTRFKQGTGIEMNDWLAEHLKIRYSDRVVPFGIEGEEAHEGTG